jgi:hypothetical protein
MFKYKDAGRNSAETPPVNHRKKSKRCCSQNFKSTKEKEIMIDINTHHSLSVII